MDKVCSTKGELTVGVGCLIRHDKSKGNILLSLGRGVLIGKMREHAGETLVKVSGV